MVGMRTSDRAVPDLDAVGAGGQSLHGLEVWGFCLAARIGNIAVLYKRSQDKPLIVLPKA